MSAPAVGPSLTLRPIEIGTIALIWLIALGFVAIGTVTGGGGGPAVVTTLTAADDHMRLVRVLAWLDGAGWFDDIIDRIDPPDGAPLHWSRLVDAPLAGAILLFDTLMARDRAVFWAIVAVPLALNLAFVLVLIWMALPFLARRQAVLCAPIILGLPIVFSTLPGRIDHHAYVHLATAIVLGAFIRIALGRANPWTLAAAGAAAAFALITSGEILPSLLVLTVGLGLVWLLRGPETARPARQWSMTTLAICTLAFPAFIKPADLFAVQCDGYSVVTLAALLCLVAFWSVADAVATIVRRAKPGWDIRLCRLAAAAAIAIPLLASLLIMFPECRAGPMAQVPPDLWETWLNYSTGMSSFWSMPLSTTATWSLIFLLSAVGFAVVLSRTREPVLRVAAIVPITFSVLYFAVSFTAARAVDTLLIGLLPGYLGLASILFAAIADRTPPIRVLGGTAALLLFALLPTVTFVLLRAPFPYDKTETRCGLQEMLPVLSALEAEPTALVATDLSDGQYVLTASHHDTLAAPYHRMVTAIRAHSAIWWAETAVEARPQIVAADVDYLITCERSAIGGAFINGLRREAAHPEWLTPIPVEAETGYRLFAVGSE